MRIKKFNESNESETGIPDEYLKDDIKDALQSFGVVLKMMNGDHPAFLPGSEKYKEFMDSMIDTYYRESSAKSIKNILKRNEN